MTHQAPEHDREKPLHLRVAEALGWHEFERVEFHGGVMSNDWFGVPPGQQRGDVDQYAEIPRYDTDWSATGPLIEQYGINLETAQASTRSWIGRRNGGPYAAWRWAQPGDAMPPRRFWDDTPLLAVCRLILALNLTAAPQFPETQ